MAQLRAARVATPYGDGVPLLHEMAAAAIEARDAEIARLRDVIDAFTNADGDIMTADELADWCRESEARATAAHEENMRLRAAMAALAPQPASDGGTP